MNLKTISPFRRIGLILLFLSIAPFLLLSIYWNIAEGSFVSIKDVIGPIASEKPKDTEAFFWLHNDQTNAWQKIDRSCNAEKGSVHFLPLECIISEQKDKYGIIGQKLDFSTFGNFMDFLIEENIGLWLSLLFIFGIFSFSGATDETISISKKFYIWIKTGHWERKPKEKKIVFSPCRKNIVYGTSVIFLWGTFLLLLKYSGISLGSIPYAAITLLWLWLFCKAIGRTVWGLKKVKK